MQHLYAIINTSHNLVYIGLTSCIFKRMANHQTDIRYSKGPFFKYIHTELDFSYDKKRFKEYKVLTFELSPYFLEQKEAELWEAAFIAAIPKNFGDKYTVINEKLPSGLSLQEYTKYITSVACERDAALLFASQFVEGSNHTLADF